MGLQRMWNAAVCTTSKPSSCSFWLYYKWHIWLGQGVRPITYKRFSRGCGHDGNIPEMERLLEQFQQERSRALSTQQVHGTHLGFSWPKWNLDWCQWKHQCSQQSTSSQNELQWKKSLTLMKKNNRCVQKCLHWKRQNCFDISVIGNKRNVRFWISFQ